MCPRRLRNLERAPGDGARIFIARSFRARLLGLAGLADLPADCALLIPRCSAVHTFGMRFPIDVVFLDSDGREIDAVRAVRPGRLVSRRGAAAVIERRAAQPEPTSAASR